MENNEIVKLTNVSKTYGAASTARQVLNPVNIELCKGEFILLIGPSGSGKTTLLTLIAGFQSSTVGDVYLFNRRIQSYSQKDLQMLRAESIGFVFQQFHLLESLSVIENILLVTKFAGRAKQVAVRKADELLEKFQVAHLKNSNPGKLSQGEKQRIAVIRALVNDAPLIIADEPTGNLSTDQGMAIVRFLKDFVKQENRLVIVASHDERISEFADRVFVMKDGTLNEKKF
jgi:putative ABC transport system ATP-binding protein